MTSRSVRNYRSFVGCWWTISVLKEKVERETGILTKVDFQ